MATPMKRQQLALLLVLTFAVPITASAAAGHTKGRVVQPSLPSSSLVIMCGIRRFHPPDQSSSSSVFRNSKCMFTAMASASAALP